MSTFELHSCYTRNEIAAALGGGNLQAYLPTIRGEVVAGCFRRDTNPGAPNVVLPGRGPIIERTAELFASSGMAVPVFIKESVNQWRFVGHYRVNRMSTDPAEISVHADLAGRGDVTSVLHLSRVD